MTEHGTLTSFDDALNQAIEAVREAQRRAPLPRLATVRDARALLEALRSGDCETVPA